MMRTMRRILLALAAIILLPICAQANSNISGWCESGNTSVVTSGLTSTTFVQGSFPSCTVTVFVHGGGLATIYSDNSNTPLANPFTASTNGLWLFYAAQGRYDVQMSGAGFPSPVTYSDIVAFDPAAPLLTNLSLLGNLTTPSLNGIVYVDGVVYPWTGAGVNAADTALGTNPGEVIIPSAATNLADTVIQIGKSHTHYYLGKGPFKVAGILLPDSKTDATGIGGLICPDGGMLQLANGQNRDLVTIPDFATLTGTPNFYGAFRTIINGCILDGNKFGNTTGYGLRIYGRGWLFNNLTVQNAASGGIWTEWWPLGENDVQSSNDITSYAYKIKTIYNGGQGWSHHGPNDIVLDGLESYVNGCWGFDVQSPMHASHVNTFLNDQTSPGSCGGIRTSNGGGINGNDIAGSTATGWGFLQDTTSGSNQITSFEGGGFAGPGLEIRNSSCGSFQGFIGNQNVGVPGVKMNGAGCMTLNLVFFGMNGGHAFQFISEAVPNTIMATTDATISSWYTGTPSSGDTLLLGAIGGQVNSAITQLPGAFSIAGLTSATSYSTYATVYQPNQIQVGNLGSSDDTGQVGYGLIITSYGSKRAGIGLDVFGVSNPGAWEIGEAISRYHQLGLLLTSFDTGATDFEINVPAVDTGTAMTVYDTVGGLSRFQVDHTGNILTRGQLSSVIPTGTTPLLVTSTTPVANLTLSNHPIPYFCGTTTTCAHTQITTPLIYFGTVALTSASPSTAVVTGFSPAYTSTSSYNCTAISYTTAANSLKVTNTSTSSITITGPNGITDNVSYICIGN